MTALPLDAPTRPARDIPFLLGCVALAALTFAVAAAPWIAPHDPDALNLRQMSLAPFANAAHPLGTDQLGRDLLSRTLHGGRPALAIAGAAVALAGVAGTGLGVLAAYRGGWLDGALSALVDMKLAVPNLLLALIIIGLGGGGIGLLVLVIALSEWPVFFRLTRAEARTLRRQPYLVAAELYGASAWRILWRHLARAALPMVAVAATLGLSKAIILESSLSYLGLGVQPPASDWGMMIAQGQAQLSGAWWIAIVPGVVLAVYVGLVNRLGDRIADRLSIGETQRGAA